MDMELRRISETSRSAIVLILLLCVHVAHSFYLPGVAPQDFEKVIARICAFRVSRSELDLLDLSSRFWYGVEFPFRIRFARKLL